MVYNKVYELDSWKSFVKSERLSQLQQEQFAKYLHYLQKENKKFNITRIIETDDVINYHFKDSLALRDFCDLKKIKGVADVGSGGGFPGIPIAITNPDKKVFLIEVTEKKILFLENVVNQLGLENVTVVGLDWLTFIRSTSFEIDLFLARASLKTPLLREVFCRTCFYKNSTLVYWATKDWKPERADCSFIAKKEQYVVGNKTRKLVFFKNSTK